MQQVVNNFETGEKLQQVRVKKGYSQEEVAKQLGVTNTTLSQWENGHHVPKLDYLVGLAGLYETTLDELVVTESV